MASTHVVGDGGASVRIGGSQAVSKKNDVGDGTTPILTMPQALHLILAATTQDPSEIRRALRDVAYYQKSNAKAYRSHRKRRLRDSA